MANTHDELKELNQRKQLLIRQLDRKEIEFDKYCTEINIIGDRIKVLIQQTLNDKAESRIKVEQQKLRSDTMPEEKQKKEKKAFAPRGPKTDSYASIILEVLQKKSIKTIDAAADDVLVKKPGRDKAKVKSQIIVMINEIKKGKKPQYVWDAENFLLSLKA